MNVQTASSEKKLPHSLLFFYIETFSPSRLAQDQHSETLFSDWLRAGRLCWRDRTIRTINLSSPRGEGVEGRGGGSQGGYGGCSVGRLPRNLPDSRRITLPPSLSDGDMVLTIQSQSQCTTVCVCVCSFSTHQQARVESLGCLHPAEREISIVTQSTWRCSAISWVCIHGHNLSSIAEL